MKKVVVCGLAVVFLVALTAPTQAGLFRRRGCNDCAPPCEQPCYQIAYVDKEVTCYKPEWREKEVSCTYNQVTCKPVVSKQKITVMTTEWKTEHRTAMVNVMKPKQVERDVPVCRMEQVTCVNPCTGCTYVTCKPVTEWKKQLCTVYECVPEKREWDCNVPYCKPVEKEIEVTRMEREVKPVTVVNKVRYCEMVPYKTVIKVPVKVPCPPPPPCPAPVACK